MLKMVTNTFGKKQKMESQQKILKSTNLEQPFRGLVFWYHKCDE